MDAGYTVREFQSLVLVEGKLSDENSQATVRCFGNMAIKKNKVKYYISAH